MSSEKVELKLDWCSHEAAKFACEHWHYSRCMPAGKLAICGVWESNIFIGAVIFGRGAVSNIGKPYGLEQVECIELVRIALNKHVSQVSRIMAIALKMLKRQSPGIRLIVSYSDINQGHIGAIYQACNWVYVGMANDKDGSVIIHGKKVHGRSVGAKYGTRSLEYIKRNIDANAISAPTLGKYKYLMPLDDDIRKQIEPLRKPYPKK